MTRNFIAVMWACIAVGCASNAAQHAANAATAAAYQVDIDACVTDALATLQTTGNKNQADDQYAACANMVDVRYGRTGR